MEHKKLNIIDLFAGCGGLSKGFKDSGFNTLFAIEKDDWASETYSYNNPDVKVITGDITKIIELSSLTDQRVNGIIGGPPCQGFSLSGNRDKNDPRNSLFMEFIRFVKYFKPDFFVMENVPGILSMKTKDGLHVTDIIKEEFVNSGYRLDIKVLNSADFGVPQVRKRVFFIGVPEDNQIDIKELYPEPICSVENYVTIQDAISDLPILKSGQGKQVQDYNTDSNNDYQILMRKNSKQVNNHIAMRHTARIIERFSHINQGQSLADVPKEHMQRERGNPDVISGKVYSQNNMRPYWDKPSPTIAASFQGNFVHPIYDRNFTAREAARLQSFPDTYIFCGKRTTMSWEKNLSQYQQIGNAVPPLLSFHIAKNIKKILY